MYQLCFATSGMERIAMLLDSAYSKTYIQPQTASANPERRFPYKLGRHHQR